MIVGTIALLTFLFGGGAIDTFFLAKLDKGVKEYVLEKERKTEIRADLKNAKKTSKSFDKERKARIKDFSGLLGVRNTTTTEFDGFYDDMQTLRVAFQDAMIDARLATAENIHEDEWASIVEYSKSIIDEREEKQRKKAEKKKGEKDPKKSPFFKTRKAISETVADVEKQQSMFGVLDDVVAAFEALDREIRSINAKENDVIIRKAATRQEMKQLAEETNELRRSTFDCLIQIHAGFKQNTTESEWEVVAKALRKDLQLPAR